MLVEEPLHVARRLADALLVLHHGDADIVVAMLAKADAGATATSAFSTSSLANSSEPSGRIAQGSAPRRTWKPAAPEWSSRSCRSSPPARRGACGRWRAHLADAVVRAVEGGGGGHLHRRIGAVVEVAFTRASAAQSCSLPTAKPMRQPAMEKVFDMEGTPPPRRWHPAPGGWRAAGSCRRNRPRHRRGRRARSARASSRNGPIPHRNDVRHLVLPGSTDSR